MLMTTIMRALILLLLLAPSMGGNSIHGGTFLAMAGKDSVVLVSDSRFSSQTGTMLGKHPRMIIRAGSKCFIGCYGLDADARTLMDKLREKLADNTKVNTVITLIKLLNFFAQCASMIVVENKLK